MSKPRTVIEKEFLDEGLIKRLMKNKIVSYVRIGQDIIIARYGVNKTTLKKILKAATI